ncbi:glycosyltransferase family 4 protein [Methylomagnum sp.]
MSAGRLLFFASSLGAGGAERVLSILANAWAERGKQVTVVTLATPDTDFYALDPRIERIGLAGMVDSSGPLDAIHHNLRRLIGLRRAIAAGRPEVVFSLGDQANVLTLLAGAGLGGKIIVAEHNDPRRHRIGRAWSLLRRITYPWATRVVMLTEGTRRWALTQWPRWRASAIPNPVELATPANPLTRPGCFGPRTVVTLGRLAPQKGHDFLIEAFRAIAGRFPDWNLVIFGEGAERPALERTLAEAGLTGRVHLPGTVSDVAGVLAQADLFVLSSRYEGFPMALLEAMAAGRAVVSFDCQSGPADIITPGEDGLLVPAENAPALAEAMAALMADESERRRLGENARPVAERFSPAAILAQWESLLAEASA